MLSCKFLTEKWLSCKFLAEWMVILQDSGRMNCYLARFRQNEWLSYMIMAEWMVILQDFGRMNSYFARIWQKFLQRFFTICETSFLIWLPQSISNGYLARFWQILTGGLFGWFFTFKICLHDTITKNFIEMHFWELWKLWKRTFWKIKRFNYDEIISFQRSQICCFWY